MLGFCKFCHKYLPYSTVYDLQVMTYVPLVTVYNQLYTLIKDVWSDLHVMRKCMSTTDAIVK